MPVATVLRVEGRFSMPRADLSRVCFMLSTVAILQLLDDDGDIEAESMRVRWTAAKRCE